MLKEMFQTSFLSLLKKNIGFIIWNYSFKFVSNIVFTILNTGSVQVEH